VRQRLIQAFAVLAAWLVALVLWLVVSIVDGQLSLAAALPRAVLTIGTAAVLGQGVWRLCKWMPWPEKLHVRFCALHLLAAVLYGVAWMVLTTALEPLLTGKAMWSLLKTPRAIGWVVTGVWLYAVIAGISYAIQMQQRAYENERRALRAEAGLSAARLDALQQRLHPHFLFNALHTVAALVRQDSAQAENAIEKLGDMLRYTLEEHIGNTVPFAEEWEFTRRYLDFEQLRYGERLHVTTAIDPRCMTCSAPLFALQTLVENAVHHSIATRPEGGRIEITARSDDKRLFVQVRDDGGNGLSTQNGSHFGLHALRERLNAVYGERAQLVIESDPAGFDVSFVVPRTQSEDADDD
jgi:two-component system, LytTR family, sensor kinase